MNNIKLLTGNEAIVHGSMAAGCRCYFGYPITPQNDIPELFSRLMPKAGGQFVQAESEIASANMLLGAAATGTRALTSSSSPGVSLMQEAISYMAGSELPGVIVNMNRGGPGLGDIGSAQGDYFQSTRGGGHGDYRTLVLAPGTCQEAYDMMIKSFDLAFKYRNPVLVLGDGTVGQMKEPVNLWQPTPPDANEALDWRLEGVSKNRESRVILSLHLAEGALAAHNRALMKKYEAMKDEVAADLFCTEDAKLIVVAYGSIGRIAKSSVRALRNEGHAIGLVRPLTLYPFPTKILENLASQGKKFITLEHNTGQMVEDVRLAVRKYADSDFYGYMPGDAPDSNDFIEPIKTALFS